MYLSPFLGPLGGHAAPPAEVPPLEPLPYLTAESPGVGGRIKERPGDFVVTEIPLYEPSGAGTHVYFGIEKTGIDTRAAVVRVAEALGRHPHDIGYAGMKDRHSVSRQTFSIEHVEPGQVERLDVPAVKVLWVNRHTNKLRLGHLIANRFEIRIRGAEADRLGDAKSLLATLARRGAPNFFGPQRFGIRGNGHQLGLALLRRDNRLFIDLLLGRADEDIDYGPMLRARRLYEQGKFEEARLTWPRHHRDERAALAVLAKGLNPKRARHAVDKHLQRFFLSALQSYLFNQVLAERLGNIDRLLAGDLAFRHGHGAVFRVEDPATEQPRAERLEISPSGPLYGYKMILPTGEPERIEREVLARYAIDAAWFGQGGHRIRGERRPLRIPITDADVSAGDDDAGPFILVRFALPSGAYATAVLRELMKTDTAEEEMDAESDEEPDLPPAEAAE